MIRRSVRPLLGLLLGVLFLMNPLSFVSADTASSKEEVDQKIEQTEKDLNSGKEKQNQLIEQIQEVNQQMETLQDDISDLEARMDEKQQEMNEVETALENKKKEIGKQDHALNIRLRVMYKNGDTGMMEVLLGSSSFSELLSNLDMMREIYKNDIGVLKKMKQQYEMIADQMEQLDGLKKEMEQQKDEKESGENELNRKLEELEELEARVSGDNEALEAQLDELNKEAEKLTEQLRQQQLAASTSSDSSYTGGSMLWPVPTYNRISSKYGYRFHPILHVNKMHTGVDISAASGEPILAASDGTVILSSVKGGYGNCVMIDHGGGIVTLYGHCSKLLVTAGQHADRGQTIALVGSTGMSTGPHCHFEVRVNGSTTEPLNYLDLTGINVS